VGARITWKNADNHGKGIYYFLKTLYIKSFLRVDFMELNKLFIN